MTSSDSSLPISTAQHELLSPPPSPFSNPEQPIIATGHLGMIIENESLLEGVAPSSDPTIGAPTIKPENSRPRRRITYVSRHFAKDGQEKAPRRRPRASGSQTRKSKQSKEETMDGRSVEASLSSPPVTPLKPQPRIYYGYNIDDFSSDSSLTDVPDDFDDLADPFLPPPTPELRPTIDSKAKGKRIRSPTKSPYFPHPHKHRPTFLSTLPFPPLAHKRFGLMQERLAHDPFRLLIATIFLNKTPGERAMPIFYQLMSRYPTPAELAAAEVSDITDIIYVLGFQNQRARKCVEMAKVWLERPPECGKRYRKLNYPSKGDGRDVKDSDVIDDHDNRVAWEISHLPGLGPYSHDSWRMFCRDKLRGVSSSWNGEDAEDPNSFEPEWKRVLPLDKELRAYLSWVWMKEGWIWNKETGQRTKASDELMARANGGGIIVEEKDCEHLIVKSVDPEAVSMLQGERTVEHTAGDFLPSTQIIVEPEKPNLETPDDSGNVQNT
ncbi:hypothetical protein LTR84_003481 [Exophiala bonariae]|uniref:HhH-GPD domain-containing protein n=1 Tax=Exophiala bonariae TaxID=1690606 RepID=A0AAV9NBQ2_9EURO|nr:hypothetical protein LTR84_003481 [Exophiala bonariae]